MPKNKPLVLSTAPLSKELIDEASLHNIIIQEISFIDIVLNSKSAYVIEEYGEQNITAIFTSMNAVNAVIKHLKRPPVWKIYCIGNGTRKLVGRYFGKDSIGGIGANAEELAEVISRDRINHAVFFCGDKRRDELPEKLKKTDVQLDELIVYQTIETPVKINKHYDAILFFSPSAVRSFFSENMVDGQTQLFAIGATTAEAIQQFDKNNVITPGSPGKEYIVRELLEYYKGINDGS